MRSDVLLLHPQAPAKPAVGAACNGCGVCCTLELCPLGTLRYAQRRGPCPQLCWQEWEHRYVCGLAAPTTPQGPWYQRLGQALALRWIAAGEGCDCDVQVEDSLAKPP